MVFSHKTIATTSHVLLTDSRFISQANNSIFFAIKGIRHNGHAFISDVYNKGVREFVVEVGATFSIKNYLFSVDKNTITTTENGVSILEECTFWIVEKSISALQNLAKNHRIKFNYPVIGITGSNGKTIIKEWINNLLSDNYRIIKSPRSYNSQIGVALSVWQMQESNTLGIFEAGVSQPDEMQRLYEIIQPEIGIFTNIGSAHSLGFRSNKQKITEKLRLFQKSKYIIYCTDYQEVEEEIQLFLKAVNPKIELIGWSLKNNGNYPIHCTKSTNKCHVEFRFFNEDFSFQLPYSDAASIENALHSLFASLVLTKIVSPKTEVNLQEKLWAIKPIEMRLELKHGSNDSYLIDDTYNNDVAGLEMALNFMNQYHTKRRKLLIISDILESDLPEKELYEKVSDLIKEKGIDEVIGIGEVISRNPIQQGFYYKSTDEFLQNLPKKVLESRFILVKGARIFEFERIVHQLVEKIHGTVFEINLDALTNNLNFYRAKLKPPTKLMVMVKAHAYGSGSAEIAALMQYHRVDYLGVAYTDEGVTLRQNGIQLPILVLNPPTETFDKLLDYQLEPEIYSFANLQALLHFLEDKSVKEPFKIHLKIDTGMHRLGFVEEDIETLISTIKQTKTIQIASIFSHLAGADETIHNEFSVKQIQTFTKISAAIQSQFNYPILRHICNSAGIIRFPEAHFEMVRLGIGIYGMEATQQEQGNLETVGTLKTTISQIKTVKKGESVGYSRKAMMQRDSRIATIAIGYADGFDRGFSNGVGTVLVNNKRCNVVGNVCMDMTMIDVTDVECIEGNEVIIFNKELTIKELAEKINTIPYEILTNVSERVKRIFYKE